ncbi:MAG: hypothetical protein K6T66_06045 [Peptococcaceae bacterium]|nr:hypothetical protein [Peptococcaceae bacterium]
MKKALFLVLVLLLSVSLFGCANGNNGGQQEGQPKEKQQQNQGSEKEAVAGLVEDFGRRLQKVSLQAPGEVIYKSMQENYGGLVYPSLIEEWARDPQNAPGRVVSSPWPDHIEILSIEKASESAYEVKGQIIEMTSVEMASGGVAARRPITLVVGKAENRWVITAVKIGAYEDTNATVFKNYRYGFSFSLPESWKGYSIVNGKWEGSAVGGTQGGEVVETGPVISIRHPQWTPDNKRQDIPIMVFTLAQWDSLQQGKFHIGAAPIGPSELGCNARYVFALPARYNYAFPTGYEEVEEILKSNPLRTDEYGSISN